MGEEDIAAFFLQWVRDGPIYALFFILKASRATSRGLRSVCQQPWCLDVDKVFHEQEHPAAAPKLHADIIGASTDVHSLHQQQLHSQHPYRTVTASLQSKVQHCLADLMQDELKGLSAVSPHASPAGIQQGHMAAKSDGQSTKLSCNLKHEICLASLSLRPIHSP